MSKRLQHHHPMPFSKSKKGMNWTQTVGMVLLVMVAFMAMSGCAPQQAGADEEKATRMVQDMWGREVEIKEEVTSAVIIEWEGLAAKSMQIFGIHDMLVGVDDYSQSCCTSGGNCPRHRVSLVRGEL